MQAGLFTLVNFKPQCLIAINKVRKSSVNYHHKPKECFHFKMTASITTIQHKRFQQIPVSQPFCIAYLQLYKQAHDDSPH